LARLLKEGLNATDSDKIDSVLERLTTNINSAKSNPSINLLLKPSVRKYIDQSWQFYTPQERETIKKNLEKLKQNNLTNGTQLFNPLPSSKDDQKNKIGAKPTSSRIENKSTFNPKNQEQGVPLTKQYSSKTIPTEQLQHSSQSATPSATPNTAQYKLHVAEYSQIYPEYERLFHYVNKIQTKFKEYKEQVLNLSKSVSDDVMVKLQKLETKIESEADSLGEKFKKDCEKLTSLHKRVLFLRDCIQKYVKARDDENGASKKLEAL